MNPPVGLITPVKAAIGGWLSEFYAQFQPDTAANVEWAARGTTKSMAFVPGRMVDSVEEMLSSWRVNNNSGKASTSAFLPVLLIAVAHDYTETPSEIGRPLTDYMPITLPGDPSNRSLRVRMMSVDLRAQVVVMASDQLSAMSIIGQLCLWCVERLRFKASFAFEGIATDWPVQVVSADRIALPSPIGEHMAVLPLDITFRASLPLFYGPKAGDATDGNVPPGFPVVNTTSSKHNPLLRGGLTEAEFAAFVKMSGAASDLHQAPGVILHGIVDQSTEGEA